MLAIALELAKDDPSYEDVASKFWEHFIYIAHAMSHRGDDCIGLWNEEDGFFYDVLKLPDGSQFPMKIRSMVGSDPAICSGDSGAGSPRSAARFQTTSGMVYRKPPRPHGKFRLHGQHWDGRAPVAVHRE